MPGETRKAVRGASRVLIVDDHPVVTDSLSALIDRADDFETCGVAGNAAEALDVLKTGAPDAAIVDLSLNGTDGLELIKAARAHDRRLPILVLSRHDEAVYGERALRAGARGYLTKRQALSHVLEALRQVLDGELYVSQALKDRLLFAAAEGRRQDDPVGGLSDRELEVFRLLGQGDGTRQIADRLHLGVSTVETHRRNIRRKLDLDSSRELVLHAVRWWDRQPA